MDPPVLQFHEALKDSPMFRMSLRRHEKYLGDLEAKIRDVIRLCSTMIEFGKSFVAAFFNLMTGVQDLCDCCLSNDKAVNSLFRDLTDAYTELIKFQKVLVEQAHWTIIKNLSEFLRREMGKVQEVRSHFDRVSQSLDEALIRNAQVPRHKEQEAHEARNELTAVGTCFAHTALDYVFQLNLIQSRKNHELVEAFISFLRACQTHFHQGHDMFEIHQTEEGQVQEKTKVEVLLGPDALTDIKQKSRQIERKMQDRHMLVPKEIFQHPLSMPSNDAMMEGYLFKRATNAFKTWNRRWFVVRDSQLLYCHRDLEAGPGEKKELLSHKVTSDGFTVMEADLRLCLVRSAPNNFERQSCFELVTPTKSHMLQADSQKLCDTWISAMQRSIQDAIHHAEPRKFDSNNASPIQPRAGANTSLKPNGTIQSTVGGTSPQENRKRLIEEIKTVSGNEFCADCGSQNPKWASINLGVTICIECSGIHRSLGVQYSKVRSLTLDAWDSEHIKLMKMLGNDKVNRNYLAYYTEGAVPAKPCPQSGRPQKELWIKAKYVDRCFARSSNERLTRGRKKWSQVEPTSPHSKEIEIIHKLRGTNWGPKKSQLRSDRAKSVCGIEEIEGSPRDGSGDASVVSHLRPQRSFRIVRSSPDVHAMDTSDIVAELSAPVAACSNRLSACSTRLASAGSEPALDQLEKENDRPGVHNVELIQAASKGDVEKMCCAIAQGANVNCFEACRDTGLTTPLHQTMISGCSEASEYLLLNGAKVNVLDAHQQTPLHLACIHGHTNQVVQLLKRRALQDMQNREGKTPLDIAVEAANADMVTVLRLQKLKDDMAETDLMYPTAEDPFEGIFEDISEMTSNKSENSNLNTPRDDTVSNSSDSVVNV